MPLRLGHSRRPPTGREGILETQDLTQARLTMWRSNRKYVDTIISAWAALCLTVVTVPPVTWRPTPPSRTKLHSRSNSGTAGRSAAMHATLVPSHRARPAAAAGTWVRMGESRALLHRGCVEPVCQREAAVDGEELPCMHVALLLPPTRRLLPSSAGAQLWSWCTCVQCIYIALHLCSHRVGDQARAPHRNGNQAVAGGTWRS